MASATKPRKAAASRPSSAKKTARTSAKAAKRRATKSTSQRKVRTAASPAVEATATTLTDEVADIGGKALDEGATLARGAAAATAATAIAALAGRALIASRGHRKRVLGVPLPRKRQQFGMKMIAKHVETIAGQLEEKSAHVNLASARTRQAAKILS
jgi:hypothetical protein